MGAKTAANYLLYITSETFDDLTNAKINLLLYFAQGYHLKKYKKAMFLDQIEAWEQGPTVPTVHNAYQEFGDSPITRYDESAISAVPSEAEAILFDVARKYGRYTTHALQAMARVIGSPWDQVYSPGNAPAEIPLSVMENYFSDAEELGPAAKKFKESDFIGYRDHDGILVLPKDWDG